MHTLGIDLGTATVRLAVVTEGGEVSLLKEARHRGAVRATLQRVLAEVARELPAEALGAVALTGSGAPELVEELTLEHPLPVLEDVPALTRGAAVLAPQARSIVALGAQSSAFVTGLDAAVPTFALSEGCAAGTGSFFEDQMQRLGLPLEDYSRLVDEAQSVPRLSGRCSVFAKTDIIHRQQEGVPVEDILLGLCFATVKAFKATVVRGRAVEGPVMVAGGTVLNRGVVRAVTEVFDLEPDAVMAAPENAFAQAIGAATWAAEVAGAPAPERNLLADLRDAVARLLDDAASASPFPTLPPLPDEGYVAGRGFTTHPLPAPGADGRVAVALGVDVGSTSTNLVLLDEEGNLLDAQYLRTRGNPKATIAGGLASLEERLGAQVNVVCVGATGSGRVMIGELIGADAVRDEITAQATAAVAADPDCDTVFEIGGQDSKYIGLARGQVADFQMNKVCAAGTGSFVEEQAARLGIALDEYGPVALAAAAPPDLGERCTVFMETALATAQAAGVAKEDLAAAICHSVVRNYLHKVVGTKPVGKRIVLQGGVAYNPAIVAAFRHYAGDGLTVSPWFAVSGAVGAALLALQMRAHGGEAFRTAFRGFDLSGPAPSRRRVSAAEVEVNRAFFRKVDEIYYEGYDPVPDPAKKTIGIPHALQLHKLFPMLNEFFKRLGYNVLLSEDSSEETVRLAQELSRGEVCYPFKLVHGHMEQLARAGVDYIFMPRMHTVRHIKSKVPHNYACPYMQEAPTLVGRALRLEERGIQLISPVFDMDFGQKALAEALLEVGAQLGRGERETALALMAGGKVMTDFVARTEALGDELLASLAPGERVIVLITRQYGIVDPALNMNIPELLLERGQKVITVSHLHAHEVDLSADYSGVYWPFGQHLISGAKLVRRDPRLFAVYLTNHGCGPDTMVHHLVAEEMGDKPYLSIEMDEHYSKVGVITRIEAFLNAIEHYEAPDERAVPLALKTVNAAAERLETGEPVVLPDFGLHSRIVAAWLEGQGHPVRLAPVGPEQARRAQGHLTSKEYLTFQALLGCALEAADGAAAEGGQATPGDGATAYSATLLLPSTEGAEADGQYDRVIQSILDTEGLSDLRLVAPNLEELPVVLGDEGACALFACLLAGDACYALPEAEREGLCAWAEERARAGLLTAETLAEELERRGAASPAAAERTIGLVGEWPLTHLDELTDRMPERLEAEGYAVRRMPVAEYLWMLWRDGLISDRRGRRDDARMLLDGPEAAPGLPGTDVLAAAFDGCGGSCGCTDGCDEVGAPCSRATIEEAPDGTAEGASADAPAALSATSTNPFSEEPLAQTERVLTAAAAAMARVSEALGTVSPFTASPDELVALADEGMGLYRGGGGRYRYAKQRQLQDGCTGVVTVASMYENTDTILRLHDEGEAAAAAAPVLHLSFDGTLDASSRDLLNSFLYYL